MSTETKQLLKVQFYKHCLILARELYDLSEPQKNTPQLGDQRRRRLYGSILFLAFALESFINEIAIECCKEEFDSIDKLSALDKWDIIPKLAIHKRLFKKGEEPYQSIDRIFDYRNLFAHFKPQFKDESAKDYQKMRKVDHALTRKLFNNAVLVMRIISKEFNIQTMDWLEDIGL